MHTLSHKSSGWDPVKEEGLSPTFMVSYRGGHMLRNVGAHRQWERQGNHFLPGTLEKNALPSAPWLQSGESPVRLLT